MMTGVTALLPYLFGTAWNGEGWRPGRLQGVASGVVGSEARQPSRLPRRKWGW